MASQAKTLTEDLGLNTNKLNKDLEALESRLESLFNIRWKNDPARAQKESQKYSQLILKNEKARAALEGKTQKDLQKEEQQNRNKLAQIDLALLEEKAKTEKLNQEELERLKEAKQTLRDKKSAEVFEKAGKQFLKFGAAIDKGIEEYASIFVKYSAGIDARLQDGSNKDNQRFEALVDRVKGTLAASPYLKQEKMLDNLNELIQLGVNYNVEQRAFLQSMTDKLVTTFNAFDSNLLNLIRLQQADSTAARLGMEASLTKSLNAMFKDTSYLTTSFDNVSQTLYETIAQMGRDRGVEFEYVVQKWLGTLGSVGVSDSALTKIATAINYLGTGNVEALSGDAAMQNLLTKAANIQGLSYSNMLTQGLTADTTNRLMRGIVDYVREISATENNVVRQQFGQLFGMSMADMVAALNLNTKELDTVQGAMLNYTSAVKEAQTQLNQVSSRMHISEMVDTLFDNVMATTAGNIANSAAGYMLWKSINLVEQLTGGIQIPAISVMGNMVDLDTTVTALMKQGIAGVSMIRTLVSAIGSLSNGGSLSLSNWGAEDYLRRGSGFGGVQSGYQVTRSSSTAVVSSSGEDMAEQAITAASEEGNEKVAAASSEETATEKMLKAIMIAVIGSDNPEEASAGVRVRLGEITGGALNVHVTNVSDLGMPYRDASTV